MNNSPFLRFIDLVSIDQKIQSCANKKASCEEVAHALNKKKQEYAQVIEQARQKVLQLQKEVDAQELEMKVLDTKEQDRKRLLETLFDYKECQAIKSEIENIHRSQAQQEKVVLDAWSQLENAQAGLAKRLAESADIVQKYDDELQKIEQEKQVFAVELVDLLAQRADKKNGIPEEWLEKYELMGQRVADPVVPIEHQSCGGCYQQLTMSDMMRARHGALLQCKKCFRLLYLPEVMEQQKCA